MKLAVGQCSLQKSGQTDRQRLPDQLLQRTLQQTQRRTSRDAVTNLFVFALLHKIQPGRRRQVGRDMLQAQLVQPAQQGSRLNCIIQLFKPIPRVRQSEQRVRVGEGRVLQHRQQRLQKGMQGSTADRLSGGVKSSDAGITQCSLEMRNHIRVSRADTDRLIDFFFVPLQPVGHITGLTSFVQRRVQSVVGQRQFTLGPVLRHRPTPVVEQRLAALRPKDHRLNDHPLPRRLAKRSLHQRRQVCDAHQYDPPDAVRQYRIGCSFALGIMRVT